MPAQSADHLAPTDLEFLVLLDELGRRRMRLLAIRVADPGADSEHLLPTSRAARQLILKAAPRDPARASAAARLWQLLKRLDLTVLWYEDLPLRLRAIPDPPWALYLRGSAELLSQPAIALVGARRCTARAAEWATATAEELGATGFVIVSGLALGIDAAAHRGATKLTIAVLGSGIAQPTPLRHSALAEQIVTDGGVLVSEYAPERSARAYQFPERNRLVSGLALGVVVVEAGRRSGSLITARLALEQGRELMAVPGPVGFPNSVGCHRLLREGATLVEAAGDIVDVFADQVDLSSAARNAVDAASPSYFAETHFQGPHSQGPHSPKTRSPETHSPEKQPAQTEFAQIEFAQTDVDLAQQLYLACDAVPQSLDSLIGAVQAEPSRIAYLLTLLELRGLVRRAANGYYR